MNRIELIDVLPEPFASREKVVSEVWQKNIVFEKGENYLIEANSGVGKSSLCSFIYGVRSDYLGAIKFDGEDISSFTQKEWISVRQSNISILFQDLKLFPELTSLENIELKNRLTNFKKRAAVVALFEELKIGDKLNEPISKLSFGQRQRVAFIRALCQPFNFVILDEPISHLDAENSAVVASVLQREAKEQGASIITTSIGQKLPISYDHIFKL